MIAFCLVSSNHGPMLVNRMDYNYYASGNYCGVGAQIMETGMYDPVDVKMFKDLLLCRRDHFGDGVVAIDCGANIGVHTLEWSKMMKDWGSVIAIEAQERIFYALAGNLTLQNCFNARAIHGAISNTAGDLSFPEPDYTKQGSFGSLELRAGIGTEFIGQPVDYARPTLTVKQFTLDSLNLPRVDLIKIDVEGMEVEALEGAAETIERCKPILCIETVKSDKALITAALRNSGYRILPAGMNTVAIHESDQTNENVKAIKEAA